MKQASEHRLLTWLLAIVVMTIATLSGIHASADGLAFSVQPVLPSEQANAKVTYFDVKLAPEAQTTLTVNIHNSKSTPLHLNTGLAPATTNLNGIVEYSANQERLDKSVPAKFAQVVHVAGKEETIAPNADGQVTLQVKMPKHQFMGQLAGGLTLSDADADKQAHNAKKEQGVAINNQYQFVVAVVLQNKMTTVKPKITLQAVKATQLNARNAVQGALHNETPAFVNQLSLTGIITKAGSQSPLYTTKQRNLQLAPNAIMQFPVWLKNRPLDAGRYTYTVTATSGKNHWQFKRDFTVTAKKAHRLNTSSVEVKPDHTWRNIAVGSSSGALVLVGILAWSLIRRHH